MAQTKKTILKRFECLWCCNKYSSNYELEIHLREHTNERPYNCKHCKKPSKSKELLNAHIVIHGEKLHSCSICEQQFHRIREFRVHMMKHCSRRSGVHSPYYRCTPVHNKCSTRYYYYYAF